MSRAQKLAAGGHVANRRRKEFKDKLPVRKVT